MQVGKGIDWEFKSTKNLLRESKEVFGEKARVAAGRAIRNGSIMIWPGEVRIEGIFKTIRPFAKAEIPELRDEEVKQNLRKLEE